MRVPKNTKKYVRKAISRQIETKTQNGNFSGQEITSTANISSVFSISQGDTSTSREGDRVTPVYVRVKGIVKPKSASTAQLCRLILFQWKPDRSTIAPSTASDILDTSTEPLFGPYRQNVKQFHILADRLLVVPGYTETNRSGALFKMMIPKKKLRQMRFGSSASTNDTNHIYLLSFAENVSGTSACTMNVNSQLKFKDA